MTAASNLQLVADEVVRRAQRQGSVSAREVREELVRAGLSDSLSKDVLALARHSLSYRRGRYHYTAPVSARVRAEQSQQQDVRAAVESLLRQYRSASARVERREEGRVDFIQSVKVQTEDGRRLTLLTRDLSLTGVRLLGTSRLLGQKVHVLLPLPDGGSLDLYVRILWTCQVGDDLVENGGTFLSASRQPTPPGQPAGGSVD